MKIVHITSNRATEIQHFAAMCAFDAYAEGMRAPIPDSTLPERFYQALDLELGRKAIPNEATSFFITFERALDKRNGMSSEATHWDNNIEEWRAPTDKDWQAAAAIQEVERLMTAAREQKHLGPDGNAAALHADAVFIANALRFNGYEPPSTTL
jgi:hypothetical protein